MNIAAIFNNEEVSIVSSEQDIGSIKFIAPDAEVLIVDDNLINLTVAEGLLNPIQMRITTADGGSEAINLIKEKHFDIVFMDHMMPYMDGVEATHIIREMNGDYYKNLPIIALTANAMSGAKEMFIAAGMNDFVAKPIEMVDITSKLKKWLPPEKIINCIELPEEHNEITLDGEIPLIEEFDTKTAVNLTGSVKLYLKVLEDYYNVIDKKADAIENFFNAGDIKNYTVEVHALKSSSKLVGAMQLSGMAAELEKAGHDNNLPLISQNTEPMLTLYRSYKGRLTTIFAKKDEVVKTDVSQADLNAMLNIILNKLDDFDIDSVRIIVNRLKNFKYDENGEKQLQELCNAVDEINYDASEEAANNWLNAINGDAV